MGFILHAVGVGGGGGWRESYSHISNFGVNSTRSFKLINRIRGKFVTIILSIYFFFFSFFFFTFLHFGLFFPPFFWCWWGWREGVTSLFSLTSWGLPLANHGGGDLIRQLLSLLLANQTNGVINLVLSHLDRFATNEIICFSSPDSQSDTWHNSSFQVKYFREWPTK